MQGRDETTGKQKENCEQEGKLREREEDEPYLASPSI